MRPLEDDVGGGVRPLVDDAGGRDASRRARARPAARTSFEAGSQAQQGGEQPSEPVASFLPARGLVPLLSFPRAASFPALEENSVCDRGSGIFRATGCCVRLRAA